MSKVLSIVALLSATALPAVAHADIINVNGAVTGCTTCNGSPHPVAGDTLGDFIAPVLVTLGPGTYNVTNGVGLEGALYDAWRFNGSEENWIWSFIIADATTHKVVLDSLPDANAFVGTHSAVAGSSYALNYSGSFTLSQSTQLAFITEDYFPGDNAGGVSLKVELANKDGVPEPASWALMICGLGFAGAAMRASGSKRALRIA